MSQITFNSFLKVYQALHQTSNPYIPGRRSTTRLPNFRPVQIANSGDDSNNLVVTVLADLRASREHNREYKFSDSESSALTIERQKLVTGAFALKISCGNHRNEECSVLNAITDSATKILTPSDVCSIEKDLNGPASFSFVKQANIFDDVLNCICETLIVLVDIAAEGAYGWFVNWIARHNDFLGSNCLGYNA